MSESPACKLCGAPTIFAGTKWGRWKRAAFTLRRCENCGYAFVADPWTDFAAIYCESYYAGRGADPLVDYDFELEHPAESIRVYEWRGILRAVGSLAAVGPQMRWLDFGCGTGGLVRYCRSQAGCQAVGFEEGAIKGRVAEQGIPVVDAEQLKGLEGSCDVVTAIEVFEHVENPREVFHRIRALLKPGGLLFYTTGNARLHRKNLARWTYVVPEIHISFYEPRTLDRALREAGFTPEYRGYLPGFTDILRFKILKNLRVRRRSGWEERIPWEAAARLADWYVKLSELPVAWAGSRPGVARDPRAG